MLEIQTIQKQDTTLEGYDATSATLRMIPDSSDLTSLSARYEAELQAASKVGAETVFFLSLSCASQPSYSGLSARFTGQSLIWGRRGVFYKKSASYVKTMQCGILTWLSGILLCGN